MRATYSFKRGRFRYILTPTKAFRLSVDPTCGDYLVLYAFQESGWKQAKRFKTTAEDIRRAKLHLAACEIPIGSE